MHLPPSAINVQKKKKVSPPFFPLSLYSFLPSKGRKKKIKKNMKEDAVPIDGVQPNDASGLFPAANAFDELAERNAYILKLEETRGRHKASGFDEMGDDARLRPSVMFDDLLTTRDAEVEATPLVENHETTDLDLPLKGFGRKELAEEEEEEDEEEEDEETSDGDDAGYTAVGECRGGGEEEEEDEEEENDTPEGYGGLEEEGSEE